MSYATIGPVAVYVPETIESNEQLAAEFPQWDMQQIYEKTGVRFRHIAAANETAGDLAVKAAENLFSQYEIEPESIDFLLLCTQTPDYPLPTTACLLQDRLRLPTRTGALDFNLGCSGFVYGLGLAEGLIRAGIARRVLLLTAETYSKYIVRDDRSLRTIFGDAAVATLVEAGEEPSLAGFVFGTDGALADTLMVTDGGARLKADALKARKRQRWASRLYMDGPELMSISLDLIPTLIDEVLQAAKLKADEVNFYLLHQATRLMLENLRERLQVEPERLPIMLEQYGNTVSSTVPLLIHELRTTGRLRPGMRSLLVGFGVGFSWGGCAWRETWSGKA
ncbi:MAG: ketoacyl-ACP synthase III [Pirellulales bacterium]|nr:ketoacyl-ACP synthase III [Pirellulales bacterium]